MIAGLDIRQGLKLLNGKEALYHRLLQRYAMTHRDDMASLRQQLAGGQKEDARRLAHSLKGASASLGISAVQQAASDLEAAIMTGELEIIEPLIELVHEELCQVSTAILAALPPTEQAC